MFRIVSATDCITPISVSGYEQLETVKDRSIVTVRPKKIIGSSGSVWASEYMFLRTRRPDLFEVSGNDRDLDLRRAVALAHDTIGYYLQCANKDDINMMKNCDNCDHRNYQISLMKTLISRLQIDEDDLFDIALDERLIHLRDKIIPIVAVAKVLEQQLTDVKTSNSSVWNTVTTIQAHYIILLEYLKELHLPPTKPYTIEFTDAGPGVGVSNYEVRFREVEIAILHKSLIRYRVHLASDDQGQNEAERTNAYIGKYLNT